MEVYGWVLLFLNILTVIYTFNFGWQTWKNKNWLGALFIMGLAISIIIIPMMVVLLL